MIFTAIHDVFKTEEIEIVNEEGVTIGVEEVETTVKKNQKTPIYIEIDDIRMMMPYFSKRGRMYKTRTVVKTPSESYVLNHTFDDLVEIKKQKHRRVKGF